MMNMSMNLGSRNRKVYAATALVAVVAIFAGLTIFLQNRATTQVDGIDTVGNWVDYADGGWLARDNNRYHNYGGHTPGSSEQYPYIIQTAEELAYLAKLNNTPAGFIGQYIKLDNCDGIDLSAHFWTPIKFYGGSVGALFDDRVAAHFDGNNIEIKGLKVNSFIEAEKIIRSEGYDNGEAGEDDWWDYENYNGFVKGAATGLFGEIYKTKLQNVRLVSPVVSIEHPSQFCNVIGYYDSCNPGEDYSHESGDNPRVEAVGALIGVSRHSVVLNNVVSNPDVYVGETGETQMVGGLIGYTSGFTYTASSSVDGGIINYAPRVAPESPRLAYESIDPEGNVDQTVRYGENQGAHYIGGLIGANYHSAILSSHSSPDIIFDWRHIANPPMPDIIDAYHYSSSFNAAILGSYVGGLTGWSDDTHGIAVCILNSFSSSNISILLLDGNEPLIAPEINVTLDETSVEISTSFEINDMYVGGVAGYLADAAVNTYYSGSISVNGQNESTNFGFNNTLNSFDGNESMSQNAEFYEDNYSDGVYKYYYYKAYTGVDGDHYSSTDMLSSINWLHIGKLFGGVENHGWNNGEGNIPFYIEMNYYNEEVGGDAPAIGYLYELWGDDTTDYAISFSSPEELLGMLVGGYGQVSTVISEHLSMYSSDPMIQGMIVMFGQSFIEPWIPAENGYPAFAQKAPSYGCSPDTPNTGRQ